MKNKILHFVSFPRTGTHMIGHNLRHLYKVHNIISHSQHFLQFDNVVTVIRDPLECIPSYQMNNDIPRDAVIHKSAYEQAALDYLNYYERSLEHDHIVYADFNLLKNDFRLFADQVADIFELEKADGYEDYEIYRPIDNGYDKVHVWQGTVTGHKDYPKVMDIMSRIDLTKQYEVYNKIINMAKIK